MMLSARDNCDCSGRRLRKLLQDPRDERAQVLQPIRSCAEQQYRDGEPGQVLLLGEFSIYRNENIELLCRECNQVTVLDARPASLRDGRDIVSDEIS